MLKKILKYFFILVLLASAVTLAVWRGNTKLEEQHKEMQKQIDHANRKTTQMKERYSEQKAIVTGFQRRQLTLESEKNKLEKELEGLKEDNSSVNEKVSALEDEIKRYTEKLVACSMEKKNIADKITELKNEIALAKEEHEKEVAKLKTSNMEVNSMLRDTGQRLEICSQKNARLCIIAGEVLEMYENKGSFSSFLQKEPVLQLKKVELEKFVSEYQDRIEKNRQKDERSSSSDY